MKRNIIGLIILILAFVICILAGCSSSLVATANPRVVEVDYIDIHPTKCCQEYDCWGF